MVEMDINPVCFSALKLTVTKSIPPIIYTGNHGPYILQRLNIDRITTQTYCDVFIYADKFVFPAHRCIVGMFTDFHGALKLDPTISPIFHQNKPVICINGISCSTMVSILKFIYTSLIIITKENVYEILNASHFLSILKLNEICIDYLTKNGLEITFANRMKNPEGRREESKPNMSIFSSIAVPPPLYTRAQPLNNQNSKSNEANSGKANTEPGTSKSKEVKTVKIRNSASPHATFNLKSIKAYSTIQKKAKNDPERMFKEMILRVDTNQYDDTNFFCSLFAELDLDKLSKDFIRRTVITKELIINCQKCREVIAPYLTTECPFPKACIAFKLDSPYEMIIIGGGFGYEKSVQKYNIISKQLIDLQDLPGGHYGSTAEKLDHYIYLMGGEHYFNYVFRLDLDDPKKNWEPFNCLNVGRECAASAVLNGCIYVVGGRNETGKAIPFGEVYDPKEGNWLDIPPMESCRSGLSLTEVKGKLYAIGGLDEQKNMLSSVECFDPLNNNWIGVSSMSSPRHRFSAVAYNNMIYVTGGGLCKGSPMNLVELYDTVADLWETVSPMHHPREYHCACMIDHTMYVVGGARSLGIELYDPRKDQWKIEREKIGPRFGSALVVI